MRTKETLVYRTQNLIFAIVVVCALAFTACDTTANPGGGRTDPAVTWPTGLAAGRGQTLARISLAAYTNNKTGTFAWASPNDSVGDDLGGQSHRMTFTPNDTAAYNAVTGDVNVWVSLVEIVPVKAGAFTMGPEDQYYVTLTKDFYIGKYEVTQKQWYEVMGMTIEEWQAAYYYGIETDYGRGDNYPMHMVNWYDTLVFCNRLSILEGLTPAYSIYNETDPDWWDEVPSRGSGDEFWDSVEIVADSNGYRLPTEAQWEYAAKGGQYASDPYKLFSGSDIIDEVAWYGYDNGRPPEFWGIKPVGAKAANELGIYDMSGNVWEWCWDWNGVYPDEATDPTGSSTGHYRIRRGGAWAYSVNEARSAYRGQITNTYRHDNQGFRLARPAE